MKKRFLALAITAAMLFSLIPATAFPALAAGETVIYKRKNPEYPILNAYTGSNDAFYERIKMTDVYTKYNASAQFGYAALGYNAVLVDAFDGGGSSLDLPFRRYNESVIREVSSARDNLKSNFSATFYNRWHTHNTGLGGLGAAYSVLAFMRGGLWTGGPLNYYNSFDKKTEELPRFGDNQYAVVPYSETGKLPLKLHFEKSAVKFTPELTCECGGSYVTNTMVVFKDDRAPKIKSITGAAIVPTGSTTEVTPTKYRPGDTITIAIEYDEPIRFADDSATGKEDLGISLKIDGLATPWKAKLTKLENNTLTFSYPIPTDYKGDALITALDLEPLTGQKNLKLVQVGKQQESFTVVAPDNVATLGYSTTTSYITDLAGNALRREIVPVRASVDTVAPYVSEVTFAVHPRNEDVKAMLKENGGTQKAGELDKSDTHLGLYDYIYVGLNLNERLKVAGVGTSTPVLTGCVATTNIRDKNGYLVTLSDPYVHAHINSKGLPITRLDFKESLTVFEGMTCADPDGRIKITGLTIPDSATDLAGNKFDTTKALPDTAGTYLDALPPVITTTQKPDAITNKYAVIEETGGFYFPITLDDGTSGSGVNAVNGYFVFRNDTMFEGLVGNDRYGKEHAFQYAVTALAETTADTQWKEGKMGTRYPFVQVEKGNYIHIRLKASEIYSVSDCSLDVYGCDLAGNESYELYSAFGQWCTTNNQTAQCVTNFPLSWQKDSVPPTAEVGAVKRTLEGESGKLTVEVALKDLIELSTTAKYAWGTATPPAKGDAAWKLVTGTITGRTATVTATATVAKDTAFSQHLWISTSDKSGNALIKDMGVFAYNLKGVKYTIDYSKGITNKPSIKVNTMDPDATLAIVVGAGNRNAGLVQGETYAIRLMQTADLTSGPQEAIAQNSDPTDGVLDAKWITATYGVAGNVHTFTCTGPANINDIAVQGWYTGDVTATLLSVLTTGVTTNIDTSSNGTIVLGTGYPVGTETVQLRSATNEVRDGVTQALQKPTLTVDDPNATLKQTDASYNPKTDPVVRSTLEGLTFTVGIDKTAGVPDWVMDDINYNKSSIELVSGSETITVPLRPGSNVVTVPPRADAQGHPTEPYASGVYTATLKVVCDAGGSYQSDTSAQIYIDATPEKKFTIAPLSYKLQENGTKDYQKYGLKDRTINPQMCLVDNGITYLPVTDSVSKLELTMDTKDVPEVMTGGAYSGTYAVYAWNSSAGVDEEASRNAANFISSDATKTAYAFDIALVGSAADVLTGYVGSKLPLILDTENIITVQVVNGNGILSEKRTLRVFPKSSPAVVGTLSQTHHEINGGNVVSHGDVVFTPAVGQDMAGVQLFASQLKGGIVGGDHAMEGVFTQEMMPIADGSYHMPMFIKEGGSDCYTVFAQDRYGNVTKFTYTSGGTKRTYIDEVTLDNNPPVVAKKSLTAANGLYEAVFTVDDISILSMNADRKEVYMDLNLSLSFDKAHTAALGLPDQAQLNLLITGLIGDNNWPHSSAPNFTYFAWTPESGTHETGIYDVYVVKVDRKLEVHVLGAVGYAPGAGANLPAFDLNLAVTDGFGYTGTGTATIAEQPNVKPAAVIDGTDKPAYIDNPALANDKMLQLHFTAPIKPEYSWIYPAPDKTNINWDVLERFDTVFTDAFPITDDGTWSIKFTDHFGKAWNQELVLTDVFGDYGYKIGFSTQEITKPPVMVSGVISNKNNLMTFVDFGDFQGGRLIEARADGAANDFHASTPAKEKRYTVTEDDINGGLKSFIFILCDENYKYYDKDDNLSALKGDRLTVYLPNVVTKAPVAKPRFFLDGDRSEYNESSLPRGTISGNIRVMYATDRPVMPAKGTGDSYTFTYGGPTEYTFHYVDGFGFEGSCTVNLKSLLVTLAPSAPKSYEDTDAPQVNVDIYAKRLGGYTPAGAFTMQAGVIPTAFSNVGYVQGYNLKINASDRSSYKIVLLKNAPTTLTYAGAVSEAIDGVSLLGNMITITKPATFTVAVVDNAAKESTSGSDRFTAFTIDSTALSKWIDTTPPTAEMKFEKGATLYQRMGYIKFSDDKNQPTTLDSPIMALETTGANTGWYKRMFNTNESIQVLFHDAAGNSAIANFAVSDISSAAPELTKSWSPCSVVPKRDPITHEPVLDANGNPILEAWNDMAPRGPLNSDVTVTVSSDVPTLTAEYSTDTKTWVALTATPVALTETFSGVTLARMGDSVVATYSQGGQGDLHLKFTAPNGKSKTETIHLSENVIDKTAPTFTPEVAGIKRMDTSTPAKPYAKPYAATITLTPSETVTCSNYNTLGKDGKKIEYSSSNPIKMTVTKDGNYPFHLLDLAGNAVLATVTVATGIDRKAPSITTTPDDTTKLEPTNNGVIISVTTDEACTVTCGEKTLNMTANTPQNITIRENGSYAIVATDPAGNVTIKSVNVGSIDKLAPTVSFDTGTISVRQDSNLADLEEKLNLGVTVQDNMAKNLVPTTDAATAVTLGTVGIYTVTYTATDTAGNKGTNIRFVRVYDKKLPIIAIDGEKTDPFGTMVLKSGEHTITVENLKTITAGVLEPYTLKISRGIYTAGQMKNLPNNIKVGADGKFTIERNAFYTLYIITQSRYSFVTTLYVEE